MWDFTKTAIRFIVRRDSESASCLIITLGWWLNNRDIRDMWQYLKSVEEYRKQVPQ